MFVNICETELKTVFDSVVVFVPISVCDIVSVLINVFVYDGTSVLLSTKVFARVGIFDNVLE